MPEAKTDYGASRIRQDGLHLVRDNEAEDMVRLELRSHKAGHAKRVRVLTQNWTDRYFHCGQITNRQYAAANKLRRVWHNARFENGLKVSNLLSSGGGMIVTSASLPDSTAVSITEARRDYVRAMRELGRPIERVLFWCVIANHSATETGREHGYAKNKGDGIVGLRLALNALADFWQIN